MTAKNKNESLYTDIIYMPSSDGIEIIRVLHGMMDIDAFF